MFSTTQMLRRLRGVRRPLMVVLAAFAVTHCDSLVTPLEVNAPQNRSTALSDSNQVTATPDGKPAPMTDFSVVSATDTSITVSFTEVDGGTGQPATGYDIRNGVHPKPWWQSQSLTQGPCTVPIMGTAIGASRTCPIYGLTPGTSYDLQMVAYRGTFNVAATFGPLSNVITQSTLTAPPPPPTPVTPVASVSVTPATASDTIGQTTQLTATVRDSTDHVLTGRQVTWTTSDAAIAAADSNGLVRALAAGTTTITATSEGRSGHAQIAVRAPVASVTVSPASDTAFTGQTVQFTPTVRDGQNHVLTDRMVTWSTSDTALARVDTSGLVTTVGAGNATITASSEGHDGQAHLTIRIPVATVVVAPGSASGIVGQTAQLTATVRDAGNHVLTDRPVAWSSSDTSVVRVNINGLVSEVAAGSGVITASAEGKSGQSQFTVTAPAPPPPPPDNSSEPVDQGSYIFADNFDRYPSVMAMISPGNCPAGTAGYGLPDAYTTYGLRTRPSLGGGMPCDPPANYTFVTGRGGAGNAVSNHFTSDPSYTQVNSYTWAAPWSTTGAIQLSYTGTLVMQIWFKGTGPGVYYGKWFEMWYAGYSSRVQLGIWYSRHNPSWGFNPGIFGQTDDAGGQMVPPWPNTVTTDNQWHRMTIAYRPHSAPGTRDGLARAWIDGTKIADVSAATVGITPPGGIGPWCTLAQLDALGVGSAFKVAYLAWPQLANGTTGAFDLAWDDLKIWTVP